MANNLQLNKIISIFRDLSVRDKFVNNFGFGAPWQIQQQVDKLFPLMWVEPSASDLTNDGGTSIDYNSQHYSFKVYVLDKINKGDDNYQEILSDCDFTLKTMLSEISNHQFYIDEGMRLDGSIQFTPLFEQLSDNCNGWVADLTIACENHYSPCNSPILPITGYTVSIASSITEYRLIGSQGPTGPTGATGATGPSGSTGTFSGTIIGSQNILVTQTGPTVSIALAPTISVCSGIYTNLITSCNDYLTISSATVSYTGDIKVLQDKLIELGTSTGTIFSSSILSNPNNIVLATNPDFTETYIILSDGNNTWKDQSAAGYISISTNASQFNIDEVNGISLFSSNSLFNINSSRITNVSPGIAGTDAVNLNQLTSSIAALTFSLANSEPNITANQIGFGSATSSLTSSSNLQWLATTSSLVINGTVSISNTLNMNINKVLNVASGSNSLDAVNYSQLTSSIASATASTYTYINTGTASIWTALNSITSSVSMTGSLVSGAISNTQIGFGSATNSLTSSGNLLWLSSTSSLVVDGTASISGRLNVTGTNSTFGTVSSNTTSFGTVRIGQGTSYLDFGELTAINAGIWGVGGTVPTANNFALRINSSQTYLNATSLILFQQNGNTVGQYNRNNWSFTPVAVSSGSQNNFTFTAPANTLQTASTEINSFIYNGGSRQWIGGNITTQREHYITTTTYTATASSTFSNAYGMFIEAPIASTNVNISNNWALGLTGGGLNLQTETTASIKLRTLVGTTTSAAIYLNAAVPTATNYAINGDGGNLNLNIAANNSFFINAAGTARFFINGGGGAANGSVQFSPPSQTVLLASTESLGFQWSGHNVQWIGGNIDTQREFVIGRAQYSATASSTFSNVYGLYVTAPLAATNVAFTNQWSLGLTGGGIDITTDGAATIQLRSLIGTSATAAMYMNIPSLSQTSTNYVIKSDGSAATINGSVSSALQTLGTNRILATTNALSTNFSGVSFTNTTTFTFTNPANTQQTASTEIPGFKYVGGSRQWQTGNITTQREVYFAANTYTAVGNSTFSNAYGMYIEAPLTGSNVVISNNYALGLTGGGLQMSVGTLTNQGITLQAYTGDTSYGAIYMGVVPGSTNYTLISKSGDTELNSSTTTYVNVNNATKMQCSTTQTTFLQSSGTTATPFTFTIPNLTTGSANTEATGFKINGSTTKQWNAGTITTQRDVYISTTSYSFVSTGTVSNAYGLYVEAPFAGTNATITNLRALGLVSGTNTISFGSVAASEVGIWMNKTSESAANYSLKSSASTTVINGTNQVLINGANSTLANFNNNSSITQFTFTPIAKTTQTASTEIPNFKYTGASNQWIGGNITIQREVHFSAATYTATASSTFSNVYGLFVETPIASTNMAFTNKWALGLTGGGLNFTSNDATINCENGGMVFMVTASNSILFQVNGLQKLNVSNTNILFNLGVGGTTTFGDGVNIVFNTSTGTKIGTTASQKLSFYGNTPIIQITSSVAASTFVSNTSGTLNDTATWDGYTIGQAMKALRNYGLLA